MLSHRCRSLCLSVLSVTLVYCGQTVGYSIDQDETWHAGRPRPWRHIVLDGEPAPLPQRGTAHPQFRPISVVAKWLDGSRWHLVWPRPRSHCTRWAPSSTPPQKGAPNFQPISIVTKQLYMDHDGTWHVGRPWPRPWTLCCMGT